MKAKHLEEIAAEIISMAKDGQEMRTKAVRNMKLWDENVDRRNTKRLKQIVDDIGWPTISKVGADASQKAWLLVQHATEEPAFMEQCLELMKATPVGEVVPANIAFLEDRLLTMKGKPQIYGTQFQTIHGVTKPFPIDDFEHVDERRRKVRLDTFADNEARMRKLTAP